MYDVITDYILDYIANADTTEEVLEGIKVLSLFQIAVYCEKIANSI